MTPHRLKHAVTPPNGSAVLEFKPPQTPAKFGAKKINALLLLPIAGLILFSLIYHIAELTAADEQDYAKWPPEISASLTMLAKASTKHDKVTESESPVHRTGARLVAIGDIHGDYEQAIRVLQIAGLLSTTGRWAGGDAVLVQTGDLVDRGHDSIAVLGLFERLQVEARKAKGDVVLLLGNHELMNLQSDYRYISRNELRRLGQDPKVADGNASVQVQYQRNTPRTIGKSSLLGLRRWSHVLSPDQPLGAALRRRRTTVVAGDAHCRTVFVHAGILPGVLAQQGISSSAVGVQLLGALNRGMAEVLADCNSENCAQQIASPGYVLMGDDGPVWYRGYAMDGEATTVHAHRMVIGHTVQSNGRLHTRCGGRLHLIDVGMSRAYLGATAGWECTQNSGVVAMYPDERSPVAENFSHESFPFRHQNV